MAHENTSAQADIIAFLSDPATYGESGPVCICETHGAIVFLAGSRAYKLKRAVKFPYMDYSTAALRKAMCERELEVNRRTAPEIYEGVRGIVAAGSGLVLGEASDPRAIDWVVVMKRFPQECLLEERRKAGLLSAGDMTALGDAIALFHRNAEPVPLQGGAHGIRAVVDENVAMLGDAPDAVPEELTARYATLSERWLMRLRAALGWRRRHGMVRRCHGDLHLNNVCLLGDGPILFDAIEFNDAFSCIDVGYDFAFMLMDLDSRELRSHANALLNHYLERREDYGMLECLPLFLSGRAAIRAHVAVAAERAGAGSAQGRPRQLLELAISYLEPQPPMLIAVGGLSGTGKTTAARGLAPSTGAAPGAVILRSDVTRKAMSGTAETAKLGEAGYSEKAKRDVYEQLRVRARSVVRMGHAVIVDATFTSEAERRLIAETAKAAGVPFRGLWLEAPREILERRLEGRKGDASDADVAVLAKQIDSTTAPHDWIRIDASGSAADVIAGTKPFLT